jgi:collagen type II alpha
LGHGANNQKGPDPNDDPLRSLSDDEKRAIVLKAYENLKVRFEKFKKPNGEKSYPARTCRDLAVAYPDYESGNYWIDPNDGDPRDAILVYCDLKNRASCVIPSPTKSKEITYTGREQEIWLSELDNGMKINYKADSNQLGFLQLLSTQASQNVTFHCKNTVAYFDKQKNNHRRGVKLMTWNDNELTPKGPQRLRYDVLEDGCQDKSNTWSQTVISYKTEKSSRLPLTDLAVRDFGDASQRFWIEISPVCFE